MNMPPTKYDTIALAGGLDQVTPTMTTATGVCRRAANFECSITGGYTRIAGYERFDGHARPSDATYTVLTCTLTATVSVGNTVAGMSSGATGKVILVDGGTVVVTRVTGTFTQEGISVLGVQKGTITSVYGSVASGATDADYKALAADEYRTSIAALPGSGAVLGLCYYNGLLYAWRNNAGGTAAVMYKSSASGWTAVTFNEEVAFTNANTNVGEGDTLTQGGVTATVLRVVVQTGTLLSGTNTGRLIISSRAGGNYAAGAATSTGGGALTLSGVQAAITLAPNGRYNAVVANFGAGPSNKRMYVCDGVNRAFEFDGTVMVPITTGMSPDAPSMLAVHKQQLFLAFGYSLQFSGLGTPFMWSPILGAGEIAMNGAITNLLVLPGDQSSGALGVFTRDQLSILYGSSSANFTLTAFNTGNGAMAYTCQNMDQVYFLNEQGVVSLAAAQQFGNFSPSSLTMNLRPFMEQHLSLACASGLSRERGQYRVFFSDGYGLYLTIRSGQYLGAMPVQFPNAVRCMAEGETSTGKKTSYFGSDNGMVYELDAGTSFDGTAITATLGLVFNGQGNHRVLKRYRKASVELTGQAYASFTLGYDLAYRSSSVAQASDTAYGNDLRSAYWDEFTWDNFVWDGSEVVPSEIEMDGSGENVAFRVSSISTAIKPFTINTITVHHTPRRGIR